MSFQDMLKELVEGVSSGAAATLMGTDGIAVTQYASASASDCDVETVGIEYGKVVEEIKNAATLLNLGSVEEVIVTTAGLDLLLRMVSEDYYIALVIKKDSGTGKARFLLRKAAAVAARELK